jgi:hypothetical protein
LKNTWGNSFYNVNIDVVSENQRSLYMGQHVYTSVFDNCDFGSTLGVVEVNGYYLGVTYSVTTLTFIGCSFGQAVLANASGVTLLQPIVQGALNKFQMNDIAGLTIIGGDIEGTGTYLAFGTGCLNVVSLNNVLLGFSGTYKSGSLLGGTLMDQTNDPYSMSNSNGTATALTINGAVEENMTIATLMRKVVRASHATSQQVDINLKNTNGDTYVGMTAPGDTFIDARGASGKIVLQQGGVDRIGMEASAKLIINALTSGTAGALVGYLQFTDGTTTYKIPYYAV